MINFFLKLNLNKRLAIIAVTLGVVAIFAGDPYGSDAVSFDTKELGIIVQRDDNKISASELADIIIKGNADYKLLDVRNVKAFSEYNIPGSINMEPAQLLKNEIKKNEKIILYCDDGTKSLQGLFLLNTRGYKGVKYLSGGLESWNKEILFPKIPADINVNDIAKYEKVKEVSKYFGGTPETGGDSSKTEITKRVLPKLETQSSAKKTPVLQKKKKEGC